MTVTILVPPPLRDAVDGTAELEVRAASVRDALEQIERSHPSLYNGICNETGAVRAHVNLFVNRTHLRELGGLDAPLAPGDVLIILPAVSGG